MKTLLSRLLSRWPISFLGTAVLAGLVWVFGPLWLPLEPALPRLVAVQALLLLWAVSNAVLDWRRRSRAAALDAGLTTAAAEESEAVGATLRQALLALQGGSGAARLQDLPLYVIIGPPGAGKTTALLNAGLRFATSGSAAPVPGVGGTRLCEWWFTRDAVLIDTAGRYTTQDSEAAVDRAGWEAFLALLRRTRPRQPINGVIVAISLPDAIAGDDALREAHATAIRRRLGEVEHAFGLRVPTYALFTKADLVAGFTEFFDDLDAEGRAQVWGQTFPADTRHPHAARFTAGFRDLAARLSARLLPRLAAEQRSERRAALAGFPTQFASLEASLAAFLDAAFGPATQLRGVYFASGTQEGTPLDRLTGAMARSFGLNENRPTAPLNPGTGRSFFLARLLHDVIFGEALLVREPPKRRRRRAILRGVGFATILVLLGGLVGAMAWNARSGADQVTQVATALSAYEVTAAPLAVQTVTDGDLRALAEQLDRAQALSDAVPDEPARFGLAQDEKLRAGARVAYRNALNNGLLPRLLWRLEAEMRGELGRPELLFETTRIYLMLGGTGPLDPAQVRGRLASDLALALPDEPALVATLLRHVDALLTGPLPAVSLDGPLVAAARDSIRQVPLAARVYASIQASPAAAALPPWRPADPLGLAGVTIFSRASGAPMTDGIPGVFTAPGFRNVLLPALPDAARRVAAESWVLGRKTDFSSAELQALESAVSALYVADFTRLWDAMLADLNIAPLPTLPQAAQALYILASADSPVRALTRSVAAQIQVPGAAPRYDPLIALATGDGAALERSLRLVADVQQQLAKIAALPVGSALPAGGDDISNALLADAARLPQPLNRWMSTVGATAQALRTGNARRRIALLFNTPGGPAQLCAAATTKYPFARNGPPLSMDELARVFGPGGALDGFRNTQLSPFIDSSAKPWKLQASPPSPPPLTADDAAQFGRAAAIRDALFPGRRRTPSFQLEATPVPPGQRGAAPAAGAPPATLNLGDTTIVSGTGAARPTQISWPPPDGIAPVARIAVEGAVLEEQGPWAVQRLLARGILQSLARDGRYLLSFSTLPGRPTYELNLPSMNPFLPSLFSDFRCPVLQ